MLWECDLAVSYMAEIPYFLFGLDVAPGAKATLQIFYGHAMWGDVEEYLRNERAPAPFVFCSVARIAEIYQGRRKKSTIHDDITALRAVGALVASVGIRYGRECEGWILPLRAPPGSNSALCQYRTRSLGEQASLARSPVLSASASPSPPVLSASASPPFLSPSPSLSASPPSPSPSASPPLSPSRSSSSLGASSARDLLLVIATIWLPLDDTGFPDAKLQIYPENLEGQARVERLVAHVMRRNALDRPAAFDYIVGICRRFASVCKARPEKRRWHGMGMFEVECHGGRLSRWQTVEFDANSDGPVVLESAASRVAADEHAMQAKIEREQIEAILEFARHPRPPTDYERLGWELLPYWRRVLLCLPGEAASVVGAAVAGAQGERREVTLRDLCGALNAIEMDPQAIPGRNAEADE